MNHIVLLGDSIFDNASYVPGEPTDYSEISPIEPSAAGGEKIVQTIVSFLERHDLTQKQSVIYA